MKISKYWKAVIAGLTPVLTTVQAAVGDGLAIAGALLIAFGVYRVPNRPQEQP